MRLPENKLRRLCELLREWSHKRACTKHKLLSLVGLLQHAATIVKPGRMFVQRLIDLSGIPKELHFHVRLNKKACSNIWWRVRFIKRWNCQGLLAVVGRLLPSATVQSNAPEGWVAVQCGVNRGFLSWANVSIALKESAPIALVTLVFNRDFQNHHVLFQSDNSTVAAALQQDTCQYPRVLQLLACVTLWLRTTILLLRQRTCQAGVTHSRTPYRNQAHACLEQV